MESRSSSLENHAPQADQTNVNLTAHFMFIIHAHEKLKSDIEALQASFDVMKTESKAMENIQKYAMPSAIILCSAMAALFYLCYFASRTDQGELSNLKRSQFFSLLLAAAIGLRFYFTDPRERTFRAYDWASKIPFFKDEKYQRMSHEYDLLLDSLKFFKENFTKTYSYNAENKEKMGLIFNDLEKEIEFFRANKATLTINSVEERVRGQLVPLMNQAKYELTHTPGYPSDLWEDIERENKTGSSKHDDLDDLEAGKARSLVLVQKM